MKTVNIEMVRGDTFAFNLNVPDVEVSSIRFTAKRKKSETRWPWADRDSVDNMIFQKTLDNGVTLIEEGVYRVRVAPEDTAGIPGGIYVYDLELGIGNDIYTILIGKLKLIEDVSNN